MSSPQHYPSPLPSPHFIIHTHRTSLSSYYSTYILSSAIHLMLTPHPPMPDAMHSAPKLW
ncbi:hypothetical protein GGP41_004819 [Bipolaris sorokiniana]|uniref:Uncharacterized protein n=1 Tax=Cochliobolus sativus TaxID=45130 RepID=A0A8H5ZCM0_COCSA|nr:hypothetical protein GGP41_004819 [Bipolaris sorokiniana]